MFSLCLPVPDCASFRQTRSRVAVTIHIVVYAEQMLNIHEILTCDLEKWSFHILSQLEMWNMKIVIKIKPYTSVRIRNC
jgi:hypothetical protein